MTLAIDFGTSNTVVARWNAATQQPETLALAGLSLSQGGSPPLIPSLAYVESMGGAGADRTVRVGQQVRDRGLDLKNDPRFFRAFKRGIGSSVQGFLPELDGQATTFEQIGEWFLVQVLDAVKQVPLPVESLVLTVPVDSFEIYRQWLGGVVQRANVDQVRMLDEPTAAALGYGMADCDRLLVIDFGGGTLDLSLVQLDRVQKQSAVGFVLQWGKQSFAEESGQKIQTAKVLAKAGLNLGGSDLDNWVAEWLAETYNCQVTPLLVRLAERLKIALSLQNQAKESYFDEDNFESYEFELDRNQFESILKERGFFEQLDGAMNQVAQQARRQGMETRDFDGIALVGGTSQIPAFQSWVKQYFDADKIRSDRPFEAIAQGALQLDRGVEIKDFLYHSYGIRYWNHRIQRHDWHPIIQAGQPYPMADPVKLVFGASMENQPAIEVVLGELGSEGSTTEVYFDGDRLITRNLSTAQSNVKTLNDSEGGRVIKLDPLGNPGMDRVQLFFRVDEERCLRMRVEDMLTLDTIIDDQVVTQLS